MKKLEKLTLKELEDSAIMLNFEDARNLTGGGYWYWTQATGWTYMLDEVTVYGSYSPEYAPIKSETMSFCEWTAQGDCNWAENTASAIIGAVPVAGDVLGIIANKVECERSEVAYALLHSGYTCLDNIRYDLIVGDNFEIYYDIYDASGTFICTTK